MMNRALDVLVRCAELRVPQLTSIVLGVMGAATGLLFLTRPDRFENSPSLASVVAVAPTVVWGVLFLIAGSCLINTAIVSQRRTFWYSFALAGLMFPFSILSGLGVFVGPAIGLVSLYTMGFGFLCVLTAVAAIAPQLREFARQRDETVRAEVS